MVLFFNIMENVQSYSGFQESRQYCAKAQEKVASDVLCEEEPQH